MPGPPEPILISLNSLPFFIISTSVTINQLLGYNTIVLSFSSPTTCMLALFLLNIFYTIISCLLPDTLASLKSIHHNHLKWCLITYIRLWLFFLLKILQRFTTSFQIPSPSQAYVTWLLPTCVTLSHAPFSFTHYAPAMLAFLSTEHSHPVSSV